MSSGSQPPPAAASSIPSTPMNYAQRAILTFIAAVTVSLLLSAAFDMSLGMAMLVATPGCLMVGSMFMLLHLARYGESISAKKQLMTMLIVEFLLVPLGAAVALVAYFALRPTNPPDADPTWNQPPSASSMLR